MLRTVQRGTLERSCYIDVEAGVCWAARTVGLLKFQMLGCSAGNVEISVKFHNPIRMATARGLGLTMRVFTINRCCTVYAAKCSYLLPEVKVKIWAGKSWGNGQSFFPN